MTGAGSVEVYAPQAIERLPTQPLWMPACESERTRTHTTKLHLIYSERQSIPTDDLPAIDHHVNTLNCLLPRSSQKGPPTASSIYGPSLFHPTVIFFFLMTRPPPRSPLFPYTPLFRSLRRQPPPQPPVHVRRFGTHHALEPARRRRLRQDPCRVCVDGVPSRRRRWR